MDEIFIKYISKKSGDADEHSDEKSGDNLKMTPENLADFLTTEQKIEMTAEECKQFINAFEPLVDRTVLSLEGSFTCTSTFKLVFSSYNIIPCHGAVSSATSLYNWSNLFEHGIYTK